MSESEEGASPVSEIIEATQDSLTLFPITEDEISVIIRPEFNIEKWSNWIFPHPRVKNLDKVRTTTWTIPLPDNRSTEASLTIAPEQGSKATSYFSQKVYYALIEIWRKKGCPGSTFFTSLNEIAKELYIKLNGKQADRILEHLMKLYTTRISWKLAFHRNERKEDTVKNVQILSRCDYSTLKERINNRDRFKSSIEVCFDQRILENLLDGKTIPVNWTTVKSISSGIPGVFFNRIDTIMANRDAPWERTGKGVLEELQIDHIKVYHEPRKLHDILVRIQKALQGKILSDGSYLQLEIKRTANNKDWKVVASKTKGIPLTQTKRRVIPIVNKDKNLVSGLVQVIADTVGGLEENKALYTMLAQCYREELIFRALGSFKEMAAQTHIKNKPAYFTTQVHILVHENKKQWIKDCGEECPYRPGKNMQLDFK